MEVTKESAVRIALAFYADEPCRICGEMLTMRDVEDDAVWAGYSKGNESRSAHGRCWLAGKPKESWAYPDDSQPVG